MVDTTFKKTGALFAIIWLHVSILDLFFVNYSGPVFLWEENAQPVTFATHFVVALLTTSMFLLFNKMHHYYRNGAFSIREPVLIGTSIVMILSIGYLLFV